jgi:hypothetical protein
MIARIAQNLLLSGVIEEEESGKNEKKSGRLLSRPLFFNCPFPF